MKKRLAVCTAILAAAAALGTYEWKASAQTVVPGPCVINVPAAWGQFKGIYKSGVVFEDTDGTLRLLDQMPCGLDRSLAGTPRVAVEIHRQ
jgi:hypothetical protein